MCNSTLFKISTLGSFGNKHRAIMVNINNIEHGYN